MIEPRLPRAFVRLYGQAGASALSSAFALCRRSVNLAIRGARPSGPTLYCYWHGHAFAGFLFLLDAPLPLVALAHPSLAVLPYRVLGERLGWEAIVGSTGHGGRAAADELARALRDGASAFVCPDGPRGPARVLKRGVLHIAAASGAPIVPLRFRYSRAVRLPRWDRWALPLPGSTIEIDVAPPVRVRSDDLEASGRALERALGA